MTKKCKFRRLMLLCPGLLLVQCAPAEYVTYVPLPEKARIQKYAEPVVYSREQLDSLFVHWVEGARNPINFRLEGELKNKWRELIHETAWGEFARSCTTAFLETGQVSLTLEYRDFVRLRAALKDAAFRSSLSAADELVLCQLEARVQALLRPGMSDFEKALALHDDLVNLARYDAEAGGDIADILRSGSGSCEAYCAMYSVMCALADLPARVVTGNAPGGRHAWNLVKLDGEWYHIDATWNDPIIDGGHTQVLSHAYFCLTDAEIAATHSWTRHAYPVSGSTRFYYYRRLGLYFTSFDAYWRAAVAAYNRGEARFEGYLSTYGSPQQFQRNLRHAASISARISWTGPDSASGVVIVSFE